MKEFIEKLIGRLEEYQENNTQCKSSDDYELGQFNACEYAIEIVNQLAEEYNNDGWIPCSERLPEEKGYYLVTWMSGNEKRGLWGEPVVDVLYFKGKQWSVQQMAHRRVIAWQPLPEPFKQIAE